MGKGGSAANSAPDSSSSEWRIGALNAEGYRIQEVIRPRRSSGGQVRVGVRGKWYDVTQFIERHPGGDVLLEFQDRDATAQFIAYHDEAKVLKHWKPVGVFSSSPTGVQTSTVDGSSCL